MILLLENGCFVDARDSFGRTPLFVASRSNKLECLRELIVNRADPWSRNSAGKLPSSVAKSWAAERILERAMLLSIMSRMCPKGKKDEVWQNEGVNFFRSID